MVRTTSSLRWVSRLFPCRRGIVLIFGSSGLVLSGLQSVLDSLPFLSDDLSVPDPASVGAGLLVSLALWDTYWHVPFRLGFRDWFGFMVGHHASCFYCLPFGLPRQLVGVGQADKQPVCLSARQRGGSFPAHQVWGHGDLGEVPSGSIPGSNLPGPRVDLVDRFRVSPS